LVADGRFKDHQQDEGEQRIIPVLIQAPQQHTQDLKDKKGRHGMFLEKVPKRRKRDVKHIFTP
jgi:hypothetical protein